MGVVSVCEVLTAPPAKLARSAAMHKNNPIIMTSATFPEQAAVHSQYYEAFLRKPYLWDDLFAAITRLVKPGDDSDPSTAQTR